MSLFKNIWPLCGVVGLLIVCNTLLAHQQKEAYITLLFNKNTGNLEVSHRFLLHDAEHVVSALLNTDGPLATDQSAQQIFATYLKSGFSVSDSDLKPIEFKDVGFEVEGKYFWVYQEVTPPETNALNIEHVALQELWPTQQNHINVEKDGLVRSARLSASSPRAKIELP
ncbi:MAG: hypothetical protein P8J68_07420 [Arenicellaceae bacterium]|nr:hypothetical protein [Arenicellaceae bacterium]